MIWGAHPYFWKHPQRNQAILQQKQLIIPTSWGMWCPKVTTYGSHLSQPPILEANQACTLVTDQKWHWLYIKGFPRSPKCFLNHLWWLLLFPQDVGGSPFKICQFHPANLWGVAHLPPATGVQPTWLPGPVDKWNCHLFVVIYPVTIAHGPPGEETCSTRNLGVSTTPPVT